VAETLVRTALDALQSSGYRVAQALVDASSPRRAAIDLTRGGIPRVTQLTYLARATDIHLDTVGLLPNFQWRTYGPETEADFREVLRESYIDSLDMPELEGIRSLEDVVASHCSGGRFDADRWLVGRLPGEPDAAAVLLLTSHSDRDAWEVAYLGLTPAARGRGLGRASLVHALDLARPHTARLELAVDVRNKPAERLYRRAGFAEFDQRSVHVSVFRQNVPFSPSPCA
jgi:GNAT superfamily N-acetyltransferase